MSLTAAAPAARPPGSGARWRLAHHETFDAPFEPPPSWTEDTYGDASPYHVDVYDEDGEFFLERGGEVFRDGLRRFRSFRKAFSYGDEGWLTVELYGRDDDRDGAPESGGRFVAEGGKARLVSARHSDAAIVRSTRPLPERYRVEVTVSNIDFGGMRDGSWTARGRFNGYDGDESAGPWRFDDESMTPRSATSDNGVYFLCITDYARPAPHNNVFIHHHRKVVMDTDNNQFNGASWSQVWDPFAGRPEEDGSHYVSMIWLNARSPASPWRGNDFISYTPDGFKAGPVFVDKYLDRESYVFTIERDGEGYGMSVTGRFHHGGQRTYAAYRRFAERPATWHYNQGPADAPEASETVAYLGKRHETWPKGASYPDHFFLGDPHINYYEGTVEFDDLKLYLPE